MNDTNEIGAILDNLTDEQRAELDALLSVDVWMPQPGPQMEAYLSEADVTGYGGAAGGGKTDLALGLALTTHKVTQIFRRSGTETKGLVARIKEIVGHKNGLNSSPPAVWDFEDSGRLIEFGSCPNAGDESKYQGRAKDLLVIDEAANFLESQVRFLMGWVRSADPNQRCRTLMTFNPPTTPEGFWIKDFFAPWLKRDHPNPAAPGELRWFMTVDGNDREVPEGETIQVDGVTVRAQSRTFIPARVQDNKYLGAEYMATLNAMPEPLRSKMLYGDFEAGTEDGEFQVIPSDWVDQAMKRWNPRTAKGTMDCLGVDVARGGKDETVIARRHGAWFDRLLTFPGETTPDGPTTAALVISYRRDQAPIVVDVVGWGASAFDFLKANNIQAVPFNGASSSDAISKEGGLRMVNRRAESWWKLREALNPQNPEPLALPPNEQLRADLVMPLWKITPRGIQIESKEDLKKRLGRSPDAGDAVAMGLTPVRKIGATQGLVFGASQRKLTGLTFGRSQGELY